MNKTTIIGFIIAIIALGAIVVSSKSKGPDSLVDVSVSPSAGKLSAEELTYDFGSISMKDGLVKHTFKIENNGVEPITIGKMYTSCMCTVATLSLKGKNYGPYVMPGHGLQPKINKSLEPTEEASVEVAFDPEAH